MFRASPCPSSGARDYAVHYHIGRIVLGLLFVRGKVQLGWSSVRVAGSSTTITITMTITIVVLEPAIRTLLQPNCTLPPTYSKPRTKRPMW